MAEPPIDPEDQDGSLACPACGRTMSLLWVLPKLGGLPELRTFRCSDCGNTDSFDEPLAASAADKI